MVVRAKSKPRLDDLDFLKDLGPFNHLEVNTDAKDTEVLQELDFLKSINISFMVEVPIKNIAALSKLKSLTCAYSKTLVLPKNLSSLLLRKVNCSAERIFENPKLKKLTSLKFVQSTMPNLAGISNLNKLHSLSFFYMPKLTDLSGIESLTHLEYLELNTCKRIIYDLRLPSLITLRLNNIAKIQCLDFIQYMPKLQMMTFINTLLESADLGPALEHPSLQYLGFMGSKNNYTFSEINNTLAARHGKPQRY